MVNIIYYIYIHWYWCCSQVSGFVHYSNTIVYEYTLEHTHTQTHKRSYTVLRTLSTRVKSYLRLISPVVIAFELLYVCVYIFSNRIRCALNRRCLCLSNLSINVCLTLLFFPVWVCWFLAHVYFLAVQSHFKQLNVQMKLRWSLVFLSFGRTVERLLHLHE